MVLKRVDTLYNVPDPDGATSEFYELYIEEHPAEHLLEYSIHERHGAFSKEENKLVTGTTTLASSIPSYQQALDRYEQHLDHRKSSGFPHVFSPFSSEENSS